ncbi:hypothetical protein Tco_0300683 [Tanacetum coccineum]
MNRLRGSRSFSINNFEVKFLEEENPSEQSRLGILFCKEILKGGMVRMHYAFVHDEVRPEFLESIHYGNLEHQDWSFRSLSFNVWKLRMQSSEKMNGVSSQGRGSLVGRFFEKS